MKNDPFAWNGRGLGAVGLLTLLVACGPEVMVSSSVSPGSTGGAGGSGVAGGSTGCVLPPDPPGDCKQLICLDDGSLSTVVDPSDVPPDDGLECTAEACVNGSPAHPPMPAGTPCTQGGKLCDGLGNCAECLVDADCPAFHICQQGKCVATGPDRVSCGCKDGSMIVVCTTVTCSSGPAMDMICGPLCAPAGGEQSTGCLSNSPLCAPD